MIILEIINNTKHRIPSKKIIIDVITGVLSDKKIVGDFEVGLQIVSKNKIQKLNRKYRDIDAPTDVLSFPIYDQLPQKSDTILPLGDIVICPEMIDENNDILSLVSHSTLHLLGYHHK